MHADFFQNQNLVELGQSILREDLGSTRSSHGLAIGGHHLGFRLTSFKFAAKTGARIVERRN